MPLDVTLSCRVVSRWKDVCQSKHSRMSFTYCNFVRTFSGSKGIIETTQSGRSASGEYGRLRAEVSERNRMSKDYCFLSRSVFLDPLSLFFCRDSSSNPSLGSCPCISSYTMHDSPCLHCLCTLSLVSVCVTWFNQCVCTRCLSLDKRMAQ